MSEKEEEKIAEKKLNEQAEVEDTVPKGSSEEATESHEPAQEEAELDPTEKLQKELEEEKGKYLRLYAEFENFRRRNAKERIELIGTASADTIKEMLPVLDDFDRAIESNKTIEDIEAVKEGFSLLHQKLSKILENKGLKPIETKGTAFDAEKHEAVAQVPVKKAKEKGIIIDEVEKGFTLNDKIIRHPKVVVGS